MSEYKYDILGRRIEKKVGDEVNKYIHADKNILTEAWTKNGVTSMKTYISGLETDNLIAYDSEGMNRYYFHKDHIGSIVGLTDSSWSLVEEYQYDVYWVAYVRTGTGAFEKIDWAFWSLYNNDRLFTGREYDMKTSLYYLRARYYDPVDGRFVSRDPIGQVDDLNLYGYVGNSPLKYIDLMGLEKVLILIWQPHTEWEISGFEITEEYQIQQALSQGVLRKNILSIDVTNPEEFNNATQWHIGNIRNIVYIAHGGSDYSWGINNSNVSELEPINRNSSHHASLFMISCEAWMWENSIAQQIGDQIWWNVVAANAVVTVNEPAYISWYDFWNTPAWEPFVPKWNWILFTPNFQ